MLQNNKKYKPKKKLGHSLKYPPHILIKLHCIDVLNTVKSYVS